LSVQPIFQPTSEATSAFLEGQRKHQRRQAESFGKLSRRKKLRPLILPPAGHEKEKREKKNPKKKKKYK
jgi:hypothetical protein